MTRTVLIASNSDFLRQGLDYLDTTGRYQIVAKARTAWEIPSLAEKHRPDLILIHLDLDHLAAALDQCRSYRVLLLEGASAPPAGYPLVLKTSSMAALVRVMDSTFEQEPG